MWYTVKYVSVLYTYLLRNVTNIGLCLLFTPRVQAFQASMGSGMGMGGGDQKGNRALSKARDISDPTLRMKWHVVVDTNVLHFSAEEDFEFFHTLQHGQKKVRDTVVPQQHSTIGCMAGGVAGHTNLRGVVCIVDVYECV